MTYALLAGTGFRRHAVIPGLLVSALMLNGCMGQVVEAMSVRRLGSNDGTDACRAQVEEFDRGAAFFAAPFVAAIPVIGAGGILGVRPGIIGGLVWAASAAVSAAASTTYLEARRRQAANDADALANAVATDIEQESTNIERTQQALDSVTECRLLEARRVQDAARAGEIQRQEAATRLAALRTQAERDLGLSQQAQQRMQVRAAELDSGIDVVAPGARTAPPRNAVVARPVGPVPLQAAPFAASAHVSEAPAGQPVQIVPTRNADFVAVETPAGQRLGFAPVAVFAIPEAQMRAAAIPAVASTTESNRIRRLVATNIARREHFTESVNDLQRAVATGGFDLGT